MILSESDLNRIVHLRAGKLEDVSFAALLYALARKERSVTLSITRKPLSKEIVIEDGRPVHCDSNLVHESLYRFMQSTGQLEEAAATECFNEACATGKRFGDVLLERHLVTPEELLKTRRQNLARKLLDCFSWHHGSFRMNTAPATVDSSIHVNVAQLIVIGITRFATQEQVDSSIAPLIGRDLAVHPDPFFDREEIKLPPDELAVLQALDERQQRIDELAVSSGMDYKELTRLLRALTLIGVVIPAAQLPVAAAPPEAPPTASQPQPNGQDEAPTPVLTAATAREREELLSLMLKLGKKDAFELLNVDEHATQAEVDQSFLRLTKKLSPWRYDEELGATACEVFLAVSRAYGELSNPDQRQALEDERRARRSRSGATPGHERYRIRSALLDPDVQFKRGEALWHAGDRAQALTQFEYASELDPQNAGYRAELAYRRYLEAPREHATLIFEQLDAALRIDPDCGLAHYYRGLVLRRQGHLQEAEEALRRAIEPMAPDRRPIDALRELSAELNSP